MVTGDPGANRQVGAAFDQERHDRHVDSRTAWQHEIAVCPPTPAASTEARAFTSAPRFSRHMTAMMPKCSAADVQGVAPEG